MQQFDVSKLLLLLVQRGRAKDEKESLKKLEDIVRTVFYSQGTPQASGEQFVKYLLQSSNADFKKLGIQSLRCIAHSLHDKAGSFSIPLFEDDSVLGALVYYVKDKQDLQRGLPSGGAQQSLA